MIGLRIKTLRTSKALTLKEFAGMLSTSPGFISEIENGIKSPGFDLISSLKRIFDIDLNWLITGNDIALSAEELPTEERELLFLWRSLDDFHKGKITGRLEAYNEALSEGTGARQTAVSGSRAASYGKRSNG